MCSSEQRGGERTGENERLRAEQRKKGIKSERRLKSDKREKRSHHQETHCKNKTTSNLMNVVRTSTGFSHKTFKYVVPSKRKEV